jgi:hypothetical protein
MKSDESSLAELFSARRRAIEWILKRLSDDGKPVGAEERNNYYRVPWALMDAGERGSAAVVLSWIERHALDARGDLREGPPRQSPMYEWASYNLAIIGLAAWGLGRYDTGNAIMDLLEQEYQDRDTGGALTFRPDVRDSKRQDLFPTAQLGYSALLTGRQGMADRVYGWLSRLYEAQPELPERLFTTCDEEGLVTDITEKDSFDRVINFQAPRQAFYNPGIAAAFLGRYGAATRTSTPFELAHSFLMLSERGTTAQFDYSDSKQICKYGWGAAVMLECSPKGNEFLPAVHRMADWFTACQDADGGWTDSPFRSPHPTDADRLDITAEFVLHLSTIITAMRGSSRQNAGVVAETGREGGLSDSYA